ncbi:hypothetical protein JCM11491_002606 [Sporobolomyces phaffii]
MLSPLPLAVLASLALLQSTFVSALPTSEAPTCAIKCFQKKVEEGDYLAPGAKGLHGLCSMGNWVKAYNNCLEDNCKEEYLEAAYLFGVKACTGVLTTSASHGDSTSSKNLHKSCGDDCSSSSSSTAAPTSTSASSLTDSEHPASCTCTETSHSPGATQVYVGAAPSANVTSATETSSPTATASIQTQVSPTATSGATTLSVGIGSTFVAVLAASLF